MKPFQFSSFIAFRYLSAKKSVQAINIISRISVLAVTVLAAAMIVLLSVFNGFESLLKDLYTAFYPAVKVSNVKGKWLDVDDAQLQAIRSVDGVALLSKSAEDMALIFKDESQKVIYLKGVEPQWFEVTGFDSFIVDGAHNFDKEYPSNYPGILGITISHEFGININSPFSTLDLYYPREDAAAIQMEQSLNNLTVNAVGIFSAQAEFDGRYIIVPLATAQALFDNGDKISSLEIRLKTNANESKAIAAIQKIVGPTIKVESQYEQNKTIYMVMKSEKLAIYIILSFVLLIASFTIVGVLSMIAIDKRKDMSILKALGARDNTIFKIFIFKGVYLSSLGAVLGIALGTLICVLQQQFKFIKLEAGFIISEYPIAMDVWDFVTVFVIVLLVGALAAFFPALKARKDGFYFREE